MVAERSAISTVSESGYSQCIVCTPKPSIGLDLGFTELWMPSVTTDDPDGRLYIWVRNHRPLHRRFLLVFVNHRNLQFRKVYLR